MRRILVAVLSILVFPILTDETRGQSRVTCRSQDYQYRRCPADTSGGVHLIEQLSRSPCRLGTSWGYDREGIWVDNGCAATFELSADPGSGYDPLSLCQREVIFEVQRRHGSYVRAEFEGVPTSRTENSGERRISGQIRIWNGRKNSVAAYTCWIDNRNEVRKLDLATGGDWDDDDSIVSICQSAIEEQIRREQGRNVSPGFDQNVRVSSLARGEHIVNGRGWFTRDYSRQSFEYDCTVASQTQRVVRASYRMLTESPGFEGGVFEGCDRFPVLYADDHFRGRAFSLERSVRNLHEAGFGDSASSICVPANWMVTLYEDTDFRGATLVLDGPDRITDLDRDRPDGQDWGDRGSSVEVFFRQPDYGKPPCDQTPVLFADDSFRGRQLEIRQSISDLHDLGLGDNASSLCVPRGWAITVFEDKGFSGRSLRIRGPATIGDLKRDQPDRENWGDRISSVRVEPTR